MTVDPNKYTKVKYFLMFMGYPRSGHTLIASMLNSHPNIICSNQKFVIKKTKLHEILFDIESGSTDAAWKQEVKITPLPKGDILVVGDKTGHRTTDYLRDNSVDPFKNVIALPLKWVHVVRNPFDNLTTWIKKSNVKQVPRHSDQDLFEQIFPQYQRLNQSIIDLKKTESVLTLKHELVLRNKDKHLQKLCDFLGLELTDAWRRRVVETMWKTPRITRKQIKWTPKMRKKVMNMTRNFPWLKGYAYGG